jgi:hypothetical protein
MLSRRLLLRLAARLQTAWQPRAGPDPSEGDWDRFENRLRRVQTARRRFDLGRETNLTLLRPALHAELLSALGEWDRQGSRLRTLLAEAAPPEATESRLSLSHWLAELRQIEEEFDGLSVNWKSGTVSVQTEPITLKEVALGRFELVFSWQRVGELTGSRCFDLIALDPNPARGKTGVTHPHVRDEELCAGDAGRSLEDAVNEGRLADAFLLLRSVLTTYNARSPYVPLEEWEGSSCSECGSTTDPDERSSCEACHAELCDGCICSCSACSEYRCLSCLQRCRGCQEGCCPGCLTAVEQKSFCSDCLGTCAECQARTPKEDLSDDDLCPTCLEQRESEPSDDEIPSAAAQQQDAPIPPLAYPFPVSAFAEQS